MIKPPPGPGFRVSPLPPKLDHETLSYLLRQYNYSLRQQIDEALREKKVGLSLAHFWTLYGVNEDPGASAATLAKRNNLTPQTVGELLNRLEGDGNVDRRAHPSHRHTDAWFITKIGASRLLNARAAAKPVWSRMLNGINAAELRQLHTLLKRCVDGLARETESERTSAERRREPRISKAKGRPRLKTTRLRSLFSGAVRPSGSAN